jgi:DNA-binding NarL/FixJ family response regulator
MNPARPVLRRVLIVDDHALMCESIAAILGRTPDLSACGQATSVAAALPLLDPLRPDLVLSDLSLPTGNGFALIEAAGRHRPPIPVLVLSMHSESFHAPRAFRAGAAGYVMKGDADRLLAAIRRVLAGGIVLSGHVQREILQHLHTEAGSGSRPPLQQLTPAEWQVFQLHGHRMEAAGIAAALGETPERIRNLLEEIRRKLHLANDVALLHHAILWQQSGGVAPA